MLLVAVLLCCLASVQGETDIVIACVTAETINDKAVIRFPSVVQYRSAFLLAMSHIHSYGLLKNYTITPLLVDTGPDAAEMFTKVLNISGLPSLVGIVGPDLSSKVDIVSPIAVYRHIALVSPSATSPVLSDRIKYPFFFRVVPPDTRQALAFIQMCVEFNWRSFATYSSNDIYGEYLLEAVTRAAQARNIVVLRGFSHVAHLDDVSQVTGHLAYLKESGARIYYFIGQSETARAVSEVGKQLGMVGEGYAWIASDGVDPTTVGPGWLCVSPSGYGSRSQEIRDTILAMPDGGNVSQHASCSLAGQDCATSVYTIVNNSNVPLINPDRKFVDPFAVYYYQAVIAIAYGLQRTLDAGQDIYDGDVLRQHLYNVSFPSFTSPVNFTFDENGDPRDAGYALFNTPAVGKPKQVGTIDALALRVDISSEIYWMGGQRKPPTSGELESVLPYLWELAIVFGVMVCVVTLIMYAYRTTNEGTRLSTLYICCINLYDLWSDAVLVGAIVKTILIVKPDVFQTSIIFVALPCACNVVVFSFILLHELCLNPQFYAWFQRYLETAIPMFALCTSHVGNFRLLDSGMFSKGRFKAPVSPALRRALPLLNYWTAIYSIVKICSKIVYFLVFDERAKMMFWVAVVTGAITLCFLTIYCNCVCCSDTQGHRKREEVEMNRMSRQTRMSRINSQRPGNWTFKPWSPTLRVELLAALKTRDFTLATKLLENVTHVDLTYSRLLAGDVEILAQVISSSRSLAFINLEFNDIGEEGAEFLVRGLKEQGICRSGILEFQATCWICPNLTTVHVDRALRLGIKKASAGFTSSEELAVVISDVASWAAHLIVRISVNLDVQFWLSWNGRRSLIAELAGNPSLADLILRLEKAHPKIVFRNDDKGFSAYKSACPLVKEALDDVYQFCGRYELNSTPEHRSATCVVYRATDLQNNADVVIKFMRNETQFRREIMEREGLSAKYVVPILHDSTEYRSRWADDASNLIGLDDHPLGVVMPAAERNLMIVLLQERVDWRQVTHLLSVVGQCLQHLHSNGRIHGDLKPLNIVRMSEVSQEDEREEKVARRKSKVVKKTWRLIDFDASVRISQPVGVKTSTAYCPPELACGDGKAIHFRDPEKDNILLAQPSFDVWGMGVILYRALAHQPLLEADDRDNLRGLQEFRKLLSWGPRLLGAALAHLDSVLRADRVDDRNRLAAGDLVGWLLQEDANARPSCDQMLGHAFLRGEEWFMSPMHVAVGLGEVATVLTLLNPEAVASCRHPTRKTPLHVAAENGHLDLITLLLGAGVHVDAKDGVGNNSLQSVLHLLDQFEWLTGLLMPVCKLLAKKSDLSLQEGSGVWSSLDLGLSSNNSEVRAFFANELVVIDSSRHAAIPVVSWSQIVLGQQLGSGICGTVRQCIWNGGDYAIKTMLVESQQEELKREIAINRHLSLHPHSSVVRMMGTTGSNPLGILMELYPLGSVFDYVVKGNNFRSFSSQLTILINASAGLLHLHSLDVIHRDVAARNFLIKHDLSTAICDFGLARRLPPGQESSWTSPEERRTEKVPINISAPETLLTGEYNRQTDVYMFGLFIYELLARQPPHHCNPYLLSRPPNAQAFVKQLVLGLRPEIPSDWSPPIQQLLQQCWGPPGSRPDMREVNQTLRSLRETVESPSRRSRSISSLPPPTPLSKVASFAEYGFYETYSYPGEPHVSAAITIPPTPIVSPIAIPTLTAPCSSSVYSTPEFEPHTIFQLPDPDSVLSLGSCNPVFYEATPDGIREDQKHDG